MFCASKNSVPVGLQNYGLVSYGMFVLVSKNQVETQILMSFYACVMLLPFIVILVTNIGVFVAYRESRMVLLSHGNIAETKIAIKLAVTLLIMDWVSFIFSIFQKFKSKIQFWYGTMKLETLDKSSFWQ